MNNKQRDLVGTARITGVWYLTLAITGVLGFMVFHPQIYISKDPVQTLENITEKETLARIRLLFELGVVVSQALAAVWFYKLFRNINEWGAWTLGIWGMMNSGVIMISAISMGASIEIAIASAQSHNDQVALIQLLGQLIKHSWGVGGLFFGLWLLPLGYMVIKSQRMPIWLGRILILGGIGYLLNTFLSYAGVDHTIVDLLVIPATVGEFWIIGYLLLYGIRETKVKV
jgi:hypothetical protein